EIEALLARPRERWKMIREELVRLGEKYGDKRRTQIAAGEELAYDPEAYIVHEDATVVLSRDGWLKRVREVKDPASTRLREGDAVATLLPGTTRAGRRVARVGEGDEIVSIEPVLGKMVVVATRRGKMLRFGIDDVAELSGPGRGVILMRPSKEEDDRIVGALALAKDATFVV